MYAIRSYYEQAIITADYVMAEGRLRFTQRLPLVHYPLDRMQVSYDGWHAEPDGGT